MATVPFADRLTLTHPQTGITVGVYPSSDPKYDIQLHRAASTSATVQPASSKFSEIATLGVINGGARVSYVDSLPLSKTYWWYKARSVNTGYATPSAFTTGVNSLAGTLPTTAPGVLPFSGRPIPVSIRLTTNATLQLASTAGSTAGKLKKTLRFPAAGFQPVSSTTAWFLGAGALGGYSLQASTTPETFMQSYIMPHGVTVTSWKMSYVRNSAAAGSTFKVVLHKVSSSGGDFLLKTFTPTTASPGTITTSTISYTYSSNGGYLFAVLTFNRAGGFLKFEEVNYTELGYSMSQYGHAY
jgi:hypothetical protein